MAKKLTALILTFMMAFGATGLVACGADDNKSETFTVMFYDGGYGHDWLEEFVKEFIAEKKYGGDESQVTSADYKLVAREDVAAYSTTIMKGKNCPDVIMANAIKNDDISDGLIEDISDVYSNKVQTSNGKVAIKDYIMPESKMMFTRSFSFGGSDSRQWAIPWTAIPLSIAYNETLLNKIAHTTIGNAGDCVENGYWTKAPTTFEELMTCFADIKAQGTVDGNKISAFGWSGKDGMLWFESLIYIWWAQYQGLDVSKVSGENAFYDFFNLDTAEKFKQTGILKSLKHIQEMITDGDSFANSYSDPSAITIKNYQPAFARGEMVFCLTGDFFAKEYKSILENNRDKVNAKLMPVPAYDSEHNENYTFLNTTSCIYIPSNAKNKDMAKEFLTFINDETHLIRFTELTGAIRPFGANNAAEKAAMKEKYLAAKEWGNFEISTLDLYFDCEDVVLAFPRNYQSRGKNNEPSLIYTYKNARALSSDYWTIVDKMRTNSVQDIVIGNKDSLYEVAVKYYRDLERNYEEYMIKSI